MSYDLTKFKHGLEELNITLTDEQIEQFLQYYEMLVEKNKVMNLTGITETFSGQSFSDPRDSGYCQSETDRHRSWNRCRFPGYSVKNCISGIRDYPDGFSEQKNPVPSGSDRCTWPKKSICRSRKSRRDGFQCYAQTAV